ncbi:cation:proton antiporter [uncultured Draconibacterium sp.]|uniref:cation:proton antiporter domain-containing protein n=1 Tax=uncultured Draconibacterium sp. TaxID=1573823 RepID=UPI002AA842F2|nr:cation:proton antiporter [uncultured Draconibacterium sp.]
MNAYLFLIGLCVIVILSFFTNIIGKKTKIPSVLLLIALGVGIQQLLEYFKMDPDYSRTLELLGIIGLIMIVLEAALDLELKRDKWPIIWKSFAIAALSLGLTSVSISFIILLFIPGLNFISALVYALPLSIMSSAIIIPSVVHLSGYKREFLIYEGTFSDILGIMVFYMIIENMHVEGMRQLSFIIGGNIFLTLAISVILSYILLYIIQNIRGEAKFFLFLAVLVLLYSVGKLFHLSSLIMILMFGLLLRNHNVLLFGKLKEWLRDSKIENVFDQFRMITIETSFLVRTFFFVVFGISLPLASLLSWRVWLISVIFLVISYLARYLLYYLIENKNTMPQALISPRGLISILLYFAIPESLSNNGFQKGILFVVIIVTNIIMGWALIANGKSSKIAAAKNVAAEEENNESDGIKEIPLYNN